jgi:hypothetical protein
VDPSNRSPEALEDLWNQMVALAMKERAAGHDKRKIRRLRGWKRVSADAESLNFDPIPSPRDPSAEVFTTVLRNRIDSIQVPGLELSEWHPRRRPFLVIKVETVRPRDRNGNLARRTKDGQSERRVLEPVVVIESLVEPPPPDERPKLS